MLRTSLLAAAALGAAAATPALAQDAPLNGTTRPAPPGLNAPNGQPAAMVTVIASPPVHNPTDGQVDGQPRTRRAATATSTAPAPDDLNARDGEAASRVSTMAAPPTHNPTDGQVDGQPDPARATPPIAPEGQPADEDENSTDTEAPAPQ